MRRLRQSKQSRLELPVRCKRRDNGGDAWLEDETSSARSSGGYKARGRVPAREDAEGQVNRLDAEGQVNRLDVSVLNAHQAAVQASTETTEAKARATGASENPALRDLRCECVVNRQLRERTFDGRSRRHDSMQCNESPTPGSL